MIARLDQVFDEGGAVEIFIGEIRKAVGDKGRWSNGWNLIGGVELSEGEKEMDEQKWRYHAMQRNGELIEWTAEALPGDVRGPEEVFR